MRIFKKSIALLCLISTLVLSFASCGETEFLRLSADKATVKPGEVVIFSSTHVTKKGEALTDAATYEITAGAENATLNGNKLTVSDTAKDGAVITVVSKMNGIVSNEVSVSVRVPQNSISIAADKSIAQRGEDVTVAITLIEDGNTIAADDAELEFVSGSEFATLVGTKLTINDNAANGSVIELVAKYKGLISNTVKVTVSIPVVGITASASKSFIPAGSFVTLQSVLSPADAVADVEWVITEGADICAVSGNILAVNEDAADDLIIKVKAKVENVESNELVFTVGKEVTSFILSLSQNALTVDRNGATDTVLGVDIYDSNLQGVTDRTVSFEIISGAEFLTITPDGNTCHFTALKHGDAVVRVSLPGTNISKTASVKVIVPPDAVKLPEVFVERLGHAYSFSMINPSTNKADRLDFNAVAIGSNACTDLKYTFIHEDGSIGDTVATWADGKITFKKEGRVTVNVSSDSGSRNEVSASYSFKINKGYNVRNYTELKNLLESNSYNGEIVNVVVTTKPTGATSYKYGYDLVPPTALKKASAQTWSEVFGSTITAKNKNVYINGNLHKIDGSQLRVVSGEEIDNLNNEGHSLSYIEALLRITPEAADAAQLAGRQHFVKIFDFEVVGNTPIDFNGDLNVKVPRGAYNTGIYIGSADYQVVYHLEMANVTASRCHVGLRFRRTVSDSTIDNLKVYNCFSNGIETEASVITFGDMTFGKCGAAGIEMVPKNSTGAGDTMDQLQKITFAGIIDAKDNLNNGNTSYFQHLEIPVTQIITGVVSQYSDSAISHMMNGKNEFNFVTFIFHDMSTGSPNMSQATYPAYQNGGIINATDLPTNGVDTQHEYIRLEISYGGQPVGYALLYNHHYAK